MLAPAAMMNPNERKIADMTVSEFQEFLHASVQNAVLEVMLELQATANAEALLEEEAMRDYLGDLLRQSEQAPRRRSNHNDDKPDVART